MLVPNQQPVVDPGPIRLAVIGEAPGLEEVSWRTCCRGHGFAGEQWQYGTRVNVTRCPTCGSTELQETPRPFVGPSGRFLNWLLEEAGIHRSRVFVGNIARNEMHPSELNDPGRLAWDLDQLRKDLEKFNPNCCLILGNHALRAFHPKHWAAVEKNALAGPESDDDEGAATPTLPGIEIPRHARRAAKSGFLVRISDWRGSIFLGDLNGWPCKCVATYHPAAVLHAGPRAEGAPGANPEYESLMKFDIRRAVEEAKRPEVDIPDRKVLAPGSVTEIVRALDGIRLHQIRVGFDLEGWATTGMSDCSFALSPGQALWIPFRHVDGSPWWSPADQHTIMEAIRGVLEDPAVPKVMHNALYEMFVLAWAHKIRLRGVAGDTMLAWHEAYPELDKALDVAASILTRQPFWKDGRDAHSDEARAEYNCTDSCVTLELESLILAELSPGQRAHYDFNLRLLPAMSDQMLRGIRFDVAARKQLVAEIEREILQLQGELDRLAGIRHPTLALVAQAACYKKKLENVNTWADVIAAAKPTWKEPLDGDYQFTEPPKEDDDAPF